ncbi:hypothetical protein VTK56DRAFT_6905 [Thermocarpiscus australiensis]
MFTQPAASPTPPGPGNLAVSSVSTSSASPPARTSRLRGLGYLRNYTQTHLLSREHSAHSGHGSAASSSQTVSSSSSLSAIASPSLNTARNDPSAAADHASNPSSSTRSNRFSQLVPILPTLGLPSPAPGTRLTESSATPGLASPNTNSGIVGSVPPADDMTRARSATTGDALARREGGSSSMDMLPSIRFSTFYDPRATRPSLKFAPISRTLPTGKEVIRVGRYSERDNQPNVPPNVPSAAPVGFKSKVVSRRHCEFWYEDGKWYIKDVKSSSGTFLNHIRLSPPGTESKPYPVNDGDIVQLGIDFKGGEEMIFRCVKMRLELNRGWQNKLNTFNMATHKRLRNMTAGSADNSSSYSQDCSICLNSIAPCQSLFVAPCSHTWHYKCIRSLLSSPSYPIFICPNCRAAADLEAEVEDPEEWEQLDSDEGDRAQQEGALLQAPSNSDNSHGNDAPAPPRRSRESQRNNTRIPPLSPQQQASEFQADVTMLLDSPPRLPAVQTDGAAGGIGEGGVLPEPGRSNPMPIPAPAGGQRTVSGEGRREARTPSPTGGPVVNGHGHEGPITPRNDAGPWVFDGSGVRLGAAIGAGAGAGADDGGGGGAAAAAAPAPRVSSLEGVVRPVGGRPVAGG